MEQIYYTQCPVGYGLGASNGFQVKRVTPGYPLSGDFRHLGLRAFPAGGRVLAPPSLRYRRAGDAAEIAWLTPRAMEYETERGLWGRPGGHFAHGLILSRSELRALDDWPAGLFAARLWQRSDPEPSRGRTPEPIVLLRDDLITSPNLASVAHLAEGLDSALLARLMSTLANVAREGQTLFLIDEPGRLGPRVALLTFLVPPAFRESVTFSTYHDRPEELPGYRIHGTTPTARPNRGLLLTQGVVADLTTGAIEPRREPSAWAIEVARWVESGAESAWCDFARRFAIAGTVPGINPWDDAWLNRLVGYGRAVGRGAGDADWAEETDLAGWATGSGLAAEWANARGPDWWRQADVHPAGRTALVTLARWPMSWKRHRPADWGEAVARWFADTGPTDREVAAVAFARGAPSGSARYTFVQALRRALSEEAWSGVRQRLDAEFAGDPRTVALWAIPEAVAAAVAGQGEALAELARAFDRLEEPTETLLEAARVEAEGDPGSVARLGEILSGRFEQPEALRWALRQGIQAVDWLRPYLRHLLATPDDREGRRALLDATPAELRPTLARAVLDVASDMGMPDDAFVWGVEELLLPLPEPDRPADPAWPGRYLDRSGSDLDLIGRLYSTRSRQPGLSRWLTEAERAGRLSPIHEDRLAHLGRLARALGAPGPMALETIDLARIPDRDRARLLGRFLRRASLSRADMLAIFDRCGAAWAESLRSGSSGLEEIARTLAGSEWFQRIEEPDAWFSYLDDVGRRLDRATPESERFAPGGLAALVVANRNYAEGQAPATWGLRRYLLQNEAGWRTLAEDIRLAMAECEPAASPEIVATWDHRVEQRLRVARFWEVILNACDGRRLLPVVSAHVDKLRPLRPLPWWDHERHVGARNDLRDAFTRLVPMAPLTAGPAVQKSIRDWLGFEGPPANGPRDVSIEFNPNSAPLHLSPRGLARWRCIESLTWDLSDPKLDDQGRRFRIRDWCERIHGSSEGRRYKLPLGDIPLDDRYRLVAWVLHTLGDPSALDTGRVASWLVHSGVTDVSRIDAWDRELAGLVEVPPRLLQSRKELALGLRIEMRKTIEDLRESAAQVVRVDPDFA
jgi:hypothetical protein